MIMWFVWGMCLRVEVWVLKKCVDIVKCFGMIGVFCILLGGVEVCYSMIFIIGWLVSVWYSVFSCLWFVVCMIIVSFRQLLFEDGCFFRCFL